jgi:predicted nuclease of predicted toxin-antitoxin system
MKFIADMGISPQCVLFLRGLNHDAVYALDYDLQIAPDHDILRLAREEKRVLLTHDLDFAALMASSKANLPSVIIFRLADMRPVTVNHYLTMILDQHSGALQRGAILSVREGHVRVRQLPV